MLPIVPHALSFIILAFLVETYSIDHFANDSQVVYIRGSDRFKPCQLQPESRSKSVQIICSALASRSFGNALPIVQPEGHKIAAIHIAGNPHIVRCPHNAFSTELVSAFDSLETLTIQGTALTQFDTGCLSGLQGLRVLKLYNMKQNSKPSTADGVAALFSEINRLSSLVELDLRGMDLSSGLGEYFVGPNAKLKRLLLSNNNLTRIHNNAFNSNQSTLEELHLRGQPNAWKLMRNAAKWARPLLGLEHVSFQGSWIRLTGDGKRQVLNFGTQINDRLVGLNIQNCHLSHLDPSRGGLGLDLLGSHLTELWIGMNEFDRKRYGEAFLDGLKVLENLKIIHLENNAKPMESIPGQVLTQLPLLERVYLRNNGIHLLEIGKLPRSVRTIDLSKNPVELVDEDWLESVPDLTTLRLNNIDLGRIKIGATPANWGRLLEPVSFSLRTLSLSGCQIESTALENPPGDLFESSFNEGINTRFTLDLSNLSKLTTLILSNNRLTSIPSDAFSGMGELKRLDLSWNNLSSIESRHQIITKRSGPINLRTLRRSLETLDLRHNRLTSLDRCANSLGFALPLDDLLPQGLNRPANLKQFAEEGAGQTPKPTQPNGLMLTDNPFVCDCQMAWLRHYIEETENEIDDQASTNNETHSTLHVQLDDYLNFECAGENEWTGHRFFSLSVAQLYSVEHDICTTGSISFGKMNTSGIILPQCPRGRIVMNRAQLQNVVVVDSGLPQTSHFGLSSEAFILLCVAASASLAFVIAGAVVISWLCIRIRRRNSTKIRHPVQPMWNEVGPLCWSACACCANKYGRGSKKLDNRKVRWYTDETSTSHFHRLRFTPLVSRDDRQKVSKIDETAEDMEAIDYCDTYHGLILPVKTHDDKRKRTNMPPTSSRDRLGQLSDAKNFEKAEKERTVSMSSVASDVIPQRPSYPLPPIPRTVKTKSTSELNDLARPRSSIQQLQSTEEGKSRNSSTTVESQVDIPLPKSSTGSILSRPSFGIRHKSTKRQTKSACSQVKSTGWWKSLWHQQKRGRSSDDDADQYAQLKNAAIEAEADTNGKMMQGPRLPQPLLEYVLPQNQASDELTIPHDYLPMSSGTKQHTSHSGTTDHNVDEYLVGLGPLHPQPIPIDPVLNVYINQHLTYADVNGESSEKESLVSSHEESIPLPSKASCTDCDDNDESGDDQGYLKPTQVGDDDGYIKPTRVSAGDQLKKSGHKLSMCD